MNRLEEIKAGIIIFFDALMRGQFKYSLIVLHVLIFGKKVKEK